jgi:hypothetical protein
MNDWDPLFDEIFHFRGKWEVPSQCGLKIVRKKEQTIILVTEFYDSNPGTSITNWNTHLAKEICHKFEIDPVRMIFIEHSPEMSSSLTFYKETFDRVEFIWDGESFTEPKWIRMDKDEVLTLLND